MVPRIWAASKNCRSGINTTAIMIRFRDERVCLFEETDFLHFDITPVRT